jgi:hypothetical protein
MNELGERTEIAAKQSAELLPTVKKLAAKERLGNLMRSHEADLTCSALLLASSSAADVLLPGECRRQPALMCHFAEQGYIMVLAPVHLQEL